MLLGRYIAQHAGIQNIAEYIREDLGARIPGGLGWEKWHADRPSPQSRVLGWVDPLLIAFPLVSVLALGWVIPEIFAGEWTASRVFFRLGLILIWIIGAAATWASVVLMWQARHHFWIQSWQKLRIIQKER